MQIDMGKIITSIDFGSSKTTLAVGRREDDGIHVIFFRSAPSEGVKYGEIQNTTRCERVLQQLLNDAKEAIGERIEEAVVSISGKRLECEERKVSTERKFANSAINTSEIKDITEAQYVSEDESKTILEVVPQQYNVDDDYNVDFADIEGMRGKTIESYQKIFRGKNSLVETRRQVLSVCGVKMSRCIVSPVAASRAILTSQEMEKGVILIDMGKELTEVSIVRGNVIRDLFVIPFAGDSITKDISNVTEISASWAETIKVKHGYCLEEICPENKTLELINEDGEPDGEVDLLLLTRVIESRVSEIFDAIKYLVEQNKYAGKLPAGYVLTGGSAYLSYILPLAKTILGAKVRLAAPRSCIASDSESGAFDAGSSVAVGLLLEEASALLSTTSSGKVGVLSPKSEPKLMFGTQQETEESGNGAGGLFGRLRHKSPKPEQESKPEPKPQPAPAKPAEKKKETKTTTFFGDLFSDNGNGNNA